MPGVEIPSQILELVEQPIAGRTMEMMVRIDDRDGRVDDGGRLCPA